MYDSDSSEIGADIKKVVGLFELNERIKSLCLDEKERDYGVAMVINAHYEFRFKSIILRYWWRLSYKDRKELLVTYKPMFLMASTVVKPLLPGLRYVYLKIKDRKSSLL